MRARSCGGTHVRHDDEPIRETLHLALKTPENECCVLLTSATRHCSVSQSVDFAHICGIRLGMRYRPRGYLSCEMRIHLYLWPRNMRLAPSTSLREDYSAHVGEMRYFSYTNIFQSTISNIHGSQTFSLSESRLVRYNQSELGHPDTQPARPTLRRTQSYYRACFRMCCCCCGCCMSLRFRCAAQTRILAVWLDVSVAHSDGILLCPFRGAPCPWLVAVNFFLGLASQFESTNDYIMRTHMGCVAQGFDHFTWTDV